MNTLPRIIVAFFATAILSTAGCGGGGGGGGGGGSAVLGISV